MTQSRNSRYWKLGLVNALAIASLIAVSRDYAKAQIIPDNTLGSESSVITPNVLINGTPSDQIDGGAIRDSNLFHSFEQFNIDAGRGAYFTSPPAIKNIVSRVTGGNRSDILGKLGVLGNADLFLINPNGIIFGPSSSLDVRGSFLATTASSLNFADGTQFSATAPQTTPPLTVSVPVGLQFGETVGNILNQSQQTINSNVTGLQVQQGKNLALVGGNITLTKFSLRAAGGRIELGSVAGPSLVSLNSTDKGWIFGYENVQNFQDIQLSQRSFVNTIAQDTSNIQIQGRHITVTDGSQIIFVNIGAKQAGNLTVNASESVALIGTSPLGVNSGFFGVSTNAGTAGNTIINTKRLLVQDGASIFTQSKEDFGQAITATGRAGDLIVNASESVKLVNGRLFARTEGSGNAGNVRINTGRLFIQGDKAVIAVDSAGTGDAGNIEITARSIQLDNGGELIADSTSGKGGGNITLRNLDLLQMRHNSEISTNAQGTGMGGNIKIDTDLLIGRENSDITATAVEGKGGNIAINTKGIFGIEPRSSLTSESDITATSDLGIDGIVEINRPDINPSRGLVSLPAEIADVTGLIAQGCGAGGGDVARASKFIATGRGGLPPTPTEALRSDLALADLGTPVEKSQENRPTAVIAPNPINSAPTSLVEAQGWVIGSKGQVVLTAQASATSSIPWLTPNTCNG